MHPVDLPVAGKFVYENDRARLYRTSTPGGQGIIHKLRLGPDALARTRNEARILQRLAGIDGVPRLVSETAPGNTIAMWDVGGLPLLQSVAAGRLEAMALVDLARQLARVVADVHRRGVVHKNITPGNILLAGEAATPVLIDFDLATTFAEVRPGFVHHSEIAGTLAYLAPEQTGRTGRAVDYRSDLYALGATLYQLACGSPPFGGDDPLELIHGHLARVPTPPAEIDPLLPPALSDIIMRLLEKEPGRRYQSADGLAHDLAMLHQRLAVGEAGPFRLGERDFPLRLSPPSRLVGRDMEIVALRAAFDRAVDGGSRGILIAGAAGTGKSALIDQLRPVVTARRGWFLAGKFDQYGHYAGSGAVVQVLRALGRMLLAEPDAALTAQRERILHSLGCNAGLITAALPEFAVLLGEIPDSASSDPVEAAAQTRLAALGLLRAVASPERPLVVVLDDLQWAYPGSIRFIEDVLTDPSLRGLLLVGAYREAELDATHPLSVMLPRCQRLGVSPALLRLDNLGPADLGKMIGEMLRLGAADAARLADALGARTGGNPYDTLELVNTLRQDGVLVPGTEGWSFDEASIRHHIGRGEVVELLTARIARLPGPARKLLQMMACLGGDVELGLLQVASGLSATVLEDRLAPSLEDGLLTANHSADLHGPRRGRGVQFRHDRVQQAAYGGIAPQLRRALHLAAARRLARQGDYRAKAAEQYLSAVEAVHEPRERRRVAVLFHEAAAQARRTANHPVVERFLAAAMALLDGASPAADDRLRSAVETERHAALYSLGRHREADELYGSIARRCRDPLDLVDAACVQLSSLCNRSQLPEAVAFGLDLLGRLGLNVPKDLKRECIRRLRELSQSVMTADTVGDLQRAEASDRRVLSTARLMVHTTFPAFLCDPLVRAWLVLEGHRLWSEHGPCAAILYALSITPSVTIGLAQDYRTGYAIARHALAVGEARHFEPETSRARMGFGFFASHWFEPLENSLEHGRSAREGLLRAGDLQFVSATYNITLVALFDCAPTLDECDAEVDAACAFAMRAGNERAIATYVPFRQIIRALRGETAAPGSLSDASFDETAHLANVAANRPTTAAFHSIVALAGALFHDSPRLMLHSAEAMRMLPHIAATYRTAIVHLTRALALAEQIRGAAACEHAALLVELDASRDWLARRAADAPINYLHLLRFVEAERAWAMGARWQAAAAFEDALREAQGRRRPWHLALITERAGLFSISHGLEHAAGRVLLAESLRLYAAWGATAKVAQLEQDHAFLRGGAVPGHPSAARGSSRVSSDAIDLVAVLRASQALSSETSLDRLQTRVVELLGAMTGATGVMVALRHDDPPGWYLSTQGDGDGIIALEAAAAGGLLPLSAMRYAERTREPVLVEDATHDPRFAADPYIARLDCCSLLLVPILSHGVPRAMLLLENTLAHGAFTTDRLEAVTLIAGQLAVSFDNAMLYASLERRVAERTAELEEANRRLETLSITDALTGLANRRRFSDVLGAEWLRAQRQRSSIGMMMVDIDHFKSYNDCYGHVAGDACLKRVAAALGDGVRQDVDLVARYGGEEFAIVLPGADATAALEVAQRSCAEVEALGIPHEGAPRGIVTVSVGVAAILASERTNSDLLIAAADAALYRAKRHGRNQVQGETIDAPELVPDAEPQIGLGPKGKTRIR
jgi:diguanylate cyclase (GGDEF)-like protein